jgi:hypothetical protein
MKLVSFHLMPYRPLDLEEAAKHRSPWVVLPNRLYDPVKGAEEYARHIDALVYAEELGFDAIGVNEHHQTAYGLMPAPNLIARGRAGGRDAVQRFFATELRDADAAWLHFDWVDEEFHQHAPGAGRRKGHRRRPHRQRHRANRESENGTGGH